MIRIPLEEEEQVDFCSYLEAEGHLFAAVVNENKLSGFNRKVAIQIAKRAREMGKKPQFPDMLVFLPEKILFIEMKRVKGSLGDKQHVKLQKLWIKKINMFPYAEAKMCRGCQEAIDFVEGNL